MEGSDVTPTVRVVNTVTNGVAKIHRRRRESNRGQTLTEYSLILALIVLVVVATLTLLSDVVGDTLWSNKISNSFTGAVSE